MSRAFTCPGCRQMFTVASRDGNEIVQVCSVPDCRRVVWIRGAPGNGFELETASAPELSSKRFCVDQMRLLDKGVTLLSGPSDCLEQLGELLNELDPAEPDMPDIIREWLQAHGRGCTFLPGYALVHAGYAAMDARKDKHAK